MNGLGWGWSNADILKLQSCGIVDPSAASRYSQADIDRCLAGGSTTSFNMLWVVGGILFLLILS